MQKFIYLCIIKLIKLKILNMKITAKFSRATALNNNELHIGIVEHYRDKTKTRGLCHVPDGHTYNENAYCMRKFEKWAGEEKKGYIFTTQEAEKFLRDVNMPKFIRIQGTMCGMNGAIRSLERLGLEIYRKLVIGRWISILVKPSGDGEKYKTIIRNLDLNKQELWDMKFGTNAIEVEYVYDK